jgi:histone-binding protein RBBP4
MYPDIKTLEHKEPSTATSAKYRQSVTQLIKPQVKMIHPQEVNRARFMPQNKLVIGTRTQKSLEGYSDVLIYKYNKHRMFDKDNILVKSKPEPKPNFTLQQHTEEGHGICWNPNRKGDLLTCGKDKIICLWTLRDGSPETHNGVIKPERIISGFHTDSIEDVGWNYEHQNLFCSVGEDSLLFLWDSRNPVKPMYSVKGCHGGHGINCLSWNKTNSNVIATGGDDHMVNIYDVRKFTTPLHIIKTAGQVQALQWNPHYEDIIASGCDSGKVSIFDMSRSWNEQTAEEKLEGPPELIFSHEGHGPDKIFDLAWNPDEDFVIASVALDSTLQIWKPASKYCKKERISVDRVL